MSTTRRDFLKYLGLTAVAAPVVVQAEPKLGRKFKQTFAVPGQYWILEATQDGKDWEIALQGKRYKKYRLNVFPEGTIGKQKK